MTPDELVSVFAAAWRGAPPSSLAGLGPILAELCAQARAAHPRIGIASHELVEALARHAPAADALGFCARCRAPELALAVAAARGEPAAIAELEPMCAATVAAAHRRFAARGHTDDDLRQILRAKLFVAEPDQAPTIALYNGQGSLAAWLRVIATRVFIDLGRRKDRARETIADPHDLDPLDPGDLALDVVKEEYRTSVVAALRQAARELEPGDRHLLRQHLVTGLSIDQLSAVLGVHRATAARRIAKARALLVDRTRALVAKQLSLDDTELAELFGLVVSKLDLSMRRLLATPT